MNSYCLTCLVIFYLQQLDKPVLPSINTLVEQARPQDERIPPIEDPFLCTYLRDLNSLKFAMENTDPLDRLLAGFFEFYAKTNFGDVAISLNTATLHTKPEEPDPCPLYVCEPLEPSKNLTKRVMPQFHSRFCAEVQYAAKTIALADVGVTERDRSSPWGLLKLFEGIHLRQRN